MSHDAERETRWAERNERGFTLLEVLVAVLFLAVIISSLMTTVSRTIKSLDRAKLDIEASDLAQEQLRGVALAARQGTLPETGTTEGSFEGDEDLRFELKVEPYEVPVADRDRELTKRSSVFGASDTGVQGNSAQGNDEDAGPSVRRVTLRVYRASEGIEAALPLTMFVTKAAEVPESGPGGGGAEGDTEEADDDGNGSNRNQGGTELPSDGGSSAVQPAPENQ